jgi:hypothetical protein
MGRLTPKFTRGHAQHRRSRGEIGEIGVRFQFTPEAPVLGAKLGVIFFLSISIALE